MSQTVRWLALLLLAIPLRAAHADAPPIPLANLYGTAQGGFDRVSQMARRSDGRIYVADAYHHRVVVYSEQGVYLEQIGSSGSGLGQFNVASGVAFDPAGNLYVAEQFGDRITKLSPTHLPLLTFGTSGSGPGQLREPTNVAVSPDGSRLYVTEFLNDRVSMFDPAGNFLGSFGGSGTGPGQFDHPYGIVVDGTGEVFIADEGNNRVQRFAAGGAYLAEWGGLGSAPGQLHFVVGLGLDGAGNIYATDQLNNRIQKFRRDGTVLTVWGTFGSGSGQMYNPWAVLPLPNGEIWIGDTFNYRISVYGPQAGSSAPQIVSITDVPDDDGRQVRINLRASSLDVSGSPTPILQYEAFRRIDSTVLAHRGPSEPRPDAVSSLESALLEGWEFAGSIPAHGEAEYNMVVPTLVDARRNRIRYTVFFIRAATSQPTVFYDSCPDSGYSVDNHGPRRPRNFVVNGSLPNGDLALDWDPNDESDFAFYSLYRSTDPSFTPSDANKLADVTEDSFTDHEASTIGGVLYYRLSATDQSENSSDFAAASTEPLVDVSGPAIPTAFALYSFEPTPMTSEGAIRFDLPAPTEVTVRVFDVNGRLVRVLGEQVSLPAGQHRWKWDGMDLKGSRAAKGIYFCHFRSPQFSKTRTIVVAR